eukprot:TRINITY_DN11527_c0_g1_i1.p1 TRINITY_DN11527_c0_g1~~TRINITY_DN11527_c0_g1_i1.p1  ORF type:complete len:151 (-),score=30.08 TRINITY_DN11527_c0_g1_i1:17-469(-)
MGKTTKANIVRKTTKRRVTKQEEIAQFEKTETGILPSKPIFSHQKPPQQQTSSLESVKNEIQTNSKTLRSFWVPSLTPEYETLIAKPSTKTICPESGKPLRLKHLIPIQFVPLQNVSESDKSGRWMCPICYKALSNKVKCAVLKLSLIHI